MGLMTLLKAGNPGSDSGPVTCGKTVNSSWAFRFIQPQVGGKGDHRQQPTLAYKDKVS